MLSFIIPTLNEEEHIDALLSGLMPQLMGDDEVIVVDAHSKDRTPDIVRNHGASLVLHPKSGVGLARTRGAKEAKNNVLVFLDADSVLVRDFADRIRKHFSRPEIVAAGGLDLYHSDSRLWKALYNTYSVALFHSANVTHKLTGKYWIPANNCAIRKDLFFQVGGYRSVICEDSDLMRRLPASPNVVYDHKLALTLSDRRFRQDGFFRTLGVWWMSNMSAWFGKGKDVNAGYTKD